MRLCLTTILCLSFGWATASHADVVFTTFGVGDTFDPLNGSMIEGPSSAFPQIIAEQFSPSSSEFLNGASLAISSSLGAPELDVTIFSDAGGIPGTELESVHIPSFLDGLVSAGFSGNVQLNAGSNYWLAVSTTGSNAQTWLDTSPTVFGTQAASEDDGATWTAFNTDPFSRAAFLVEGTPLGPADPPDIPFIAPGEAWSFFKGLAEPSAGRSWTTQTFDDSTWNFGNAGFGYDTDLATQAGLLSHVGTELTDMRDDGVNQNAYTTLYLRRTFSVVNPFEISELVLELDYDDSFIAYVNGVEIARSSFGTVDAAEPFDALGSDHESTNGVTGQLLERYVIDLATDFPDLLQAGSGNVLSIQGLNLTLDDSDFVLSQISLGGNVLLTAGADFNGDGFVDSADLVIWQSSFGAGPGADTDNDGDTDGADFLAWQRQFTGPGTPTAVVVPEPNCLTMISLVVLFQISKRSICIVS